MKSNKDIKVAEQLDSECEDESHQFQVSNKLQEKQLEIEELSKRMRYIELDYKKREIESKAELENEKHRVQELQEFLESKLAVMKQNKEADQLQMRLSQVEDDLFEKQKLEHELLRSLAEMEQENIQLREEIEKIKMNQEHFLNSFQDIDIDKLVNKCIELEKQNAELQREAQQIKNGAIDTIVEKEKQNMELQEVVDQLKLQVERLMDETQGDLSSAINLQILKLQGEWESKFAASEERCEELQKRVEDMQNQHLEEMITLEKELNEKVYINIQEHITSAKNAEADLLQQLHMTEEKNKTQEKLLNDLQKLFGMSKEEQARLKEQLDAKQRQVNKMQEQLESVKNQKKNQEDNQNQLEKELQDKNTAAEKQNIKRDQLVKVIVNLEAENKRLKENLEINKSIILSLEEKQESLVERLEEVQFSMNMQLKELTESYEREKTSKQLEKVQQQSINKIKGAWKKDLEIKQENEQTQQPNETTPTISQNTVEISHAIEFFKERNSSDQNLINTPTQAKTLLGLEFQDEDFSIEEEKTNSLSNSNQKDFCGDVDSNIAKISEDSHDPTQMSITSTEIKDKQRDLFQAAQNRTNPKTTSAKNKFKKQFMFPQGGSTNANLYELENENNDLRKQILKLEKSVDGYTAEIANLTSEYKNTLKQLQEMRREKIMSNTEADLINELNLFKAHCQRVETQFVTQKLQLIEELHFYKEEAKIFEKQSNESRDQLIKMTQDKEYFQQKYMQLKTILKHRKTGGSLGGGGAGLFQQPQDSQQLLNLTQFQQENSSRKKTYWIFK